MRKRTKISILLIGGALLLAMLMGLVLNLYGVFDAKECNPDNLVSITAIGEENYPVDSEGNTGYGVKVEVNELGAVKVKGTATADLPWVIADDITLEEGKVYTLTAGVDSASITGYCVRLRNGSQVIYADINGTFVAQTGTYVLEVFVADETRVNTTFYPVLVEGKAEGSFYAD